MYPGSGYQGPTSRSEEFIVFKITQIEDYNGGEREFGKGSPVAILRLVGGEVSSQGVRELALSLAGLSREEHSIVPLGLLGGRINSVAQPLSMGADLPLVSSYWP